MNNQILTRWLDGWSIGNIALRFELPVQQVVQVISEEWK